MMDYNDSTRTTNSSHTFEFDCISRTHTHTHIIGLAIHFCLLWNEIFVLKENNKFNQFRQTNQDFIHNPKKKTKNKNWSDMATGKMKNYFLNEKKKCLNLIDLLDSPPKESRSGEWTNRHSKTISIRFVNFEKKK